MRALTWGLLAFVVLMITHLLIWRIKRPTGQYVGLLLLSGTILVICLFSFSLIGRLLPGAHWLIPQTRVEYVSFAYLFVVLSLSYISTYSCIQADSPSFSILLAIDEAGERGVSRQELETTFTDELLVIPRINDLVSGRLARRVGDRFVIESGGATLARIHMRYRGLLKLEKGG